MDKLIPLISELHDILDKSNLKNVIELPMISVVGSQSTGKSSVLESIIGKEILPRGKGIVTRCPIEVQLIRVPKETREWVEFTDNRGDKIYEFPKVVAKINELTDQLAGKTKSIIATPIRLKFFSPNVLDLVIIDLPGMTKNPVGDQPKDIESIIKNDVILPYVQNKNSLILAVSKATDDLANSESLKLAREVDPNGDRTVGVITQLDLMEEGTDAMSELSNKIYPLKLGYVGVVCRGAKDLNSAKTLNDQYNDEKKFFETHKIYHKYHDQMGIPFLIKTLNCNLIQHIKRALPNIRENIIHLLKLKETELSNYGDFDEIQDKGSQGYMILNWFNKFSNGFDECIKGNNLFTMSTELEGGARISYIFNEIFRKELENIIPEDTIRDEDIRIAIKNTNGLKKSLFIPEAAFENLVKKQILRLEKPALACAHMVYEELRRILYQITIPEIQRFENLVSSILKVMEKVLTNSLLPTESMIKNLIKIEIGYINIDHPDFVGGTEAIMNVIRNEVDAKRISGEGEEEKNAVSKPNLRHHKPSVTKFHFITKFREIKKDDKSSNPSELQLDPSTSNSLLNWIPFFSQKNKQADMYDSQLELMVKNKDTHIEESLNNSGLSSYFPGFQKARGLLTKKSYTKVKTNLQGYLMPIPEKVKITDEPGKREKLEIEMIKTIINSYFNVVKKNIGDLVPKTIISFLINESKGLAERELISSLYKEELYEFLLEENTWIKDQRDDLKKSIPVLKECLEAIDEIDAKF